MKSIKVCEYSSRSRSFHDDLILHDQASGERSQDQWSSGLYLCSIQQLMSYGDRCLIKFLSIELGNVILYAERCSYIGFKDSY